MQGVSDIRRVLEQARRTINYVPFQSLEEPEAEKWPVVAMMISELRRIGYPPRPSQETAAEQKVVNGPRGGDSLQDRLIARFGQATGARLGRQ